MSWCDKKSVEVIKQIRDKFGIKTFIETGTFKGINAKLHSENFEEVLTCEINREYYQIAKDKFKEYGNVHIFNMDSSDFLKDFIKRYNKKNRCDWVFIYLDAHFYDPKLLNKFVILDELKALKDFKKCVIMIHDFDNNLGHIEYDGISLNMDLVQEDLLKVNPNFKFYTNELSSCDIHTEKSIIEQFPGDYDAFDNIKYARLNPRLTYRGILYCISQEVNIDGIRKW